MQAIRNLFTALANLAGAINSLAAFIDVATGRLRQSLALDDAGPTVLEHQSAGDNAALDANGNAKGRRGRATG